MSNRSTDHLRHPYNSTEFPNKNIWNEWSHTTPITTKRTLNARRSIDWDTAIDRGTNGSDQWTLLSLFGQSSDRLSDGRAHCQWSAFHILPVSSFFFPFLLSVKYFKQLKRNSSDKCLHHTYTHTLRTIPPLLSIISIYWNWTIL